MKKCTVRSNNINRYKSKKKKSKKKQKTQQVFFKIFSKIPLGLYIFYIIYKLNTHKPFFVFGFWRLCVYFSVVICHLLGMQCSMYDAKPTVLIQYRQDGSSFIKHTHAHTSTPTMWKKGKIFAKNYSRTNLYSTEVRTIVCFFFKFFYKKFFLK